MKKMSLI